MSIIAEEINIMQNRMARVSQWLDTDQGVLLLLAALRVAALFGLTLYFTLQTEYVEKNDPITLMMLGFFAAYVISVGLLTLWWPDLLLRNNVKLAQVLAEIGFYTGFYALTGNPRSDICFLYFFPLFASTRYLAIRWRLGLLLLVSICFTLVLFWLSQNIEPATSRVTFLLILVARLFLLVSITLFHSFRRSHTLIDLVRQEWMHFTHAFNSSNAGFCAVDNQRQLIFVNDFLRRRHGTYGQGQKCSSYFRCTGDDPCAWCATTRQKNGTDSVIIERSQAFTDRNGREYQANVSSYTLSDVKGTPLGAFALVTDESGHARQSKKLQDKLIRSTTHVRGLKRERTRWFETYTELGKRLSGFSDLNELMKFVVSETNKLLEAEVSSLFLIDEKSNYLTRVATAGLPDEWLPTESYLIGQGIVGGTVTPTAGQPYGAPIHTLEADAHENVDARYLAQYQKRLASGQVKHLITVPLNRHDSSFGVLRVINKIEPSGSLSNAGFTPEDADFLVTIASMAAIAIDNTRLLEETHRSVREIRAVHDASEAMASSLQIEQVLEQIVALAGPVADSDHTGVVLVGDDGKLMTSVATTTLEPPLHKRARADGVTQQVIRTRQPIYIDDLIEPSEYAHNPIVLQQGFRSYAGIPLVARDSVRGVLFVHSHSPSAFRKRSHILEIFGNHAAAAIENGRLLQQLDREATERARRSVSEDLHDTMNVLHGSLVLGTVYHNELMQSDKIEAARRNAKKLVKAARHTYGSLRRLHEDVRDPILQNEGLIAALKQYVSIHPTMKVDFETNWGAGLTASPDLDRESVLTADMEHAIYRIAQEALSNIFKHANCAKGHVADSTKVCRGTIRLHVSQNEFKLEVIDYGHGFDIETTRKQKDAFGLQTMYRWAQSIDVKLEIHSSPEEGTTVCVWYVKDAENGAAPVGDRPNG